MKKFFLIPKWLFVVLVLIIIFRIPNLFEPYSYGDETIYLTLGEGMRRGLTLYKDIHDNKPPLLYAAAAVAGSLFLFKAILMVWMLFTTVIFWKLAVTLFPKQKTLHIVSTILFAIFTTIPLFEGHIANAELFVIGLTMGGFLLLLTKTHSYKNMLFAGALFSFATLFKVPAAFDIPAIVFLWFLTLKFKTEDLAEFIKKVVILSLGFALPIGLTFLWYWTKGAFSEYLIAAYLQNFGYLSSWRPDDVKEPFLTKNGPLLIRAGIVAAGFLALYLLRSKLSKQFIFTSAWLMLGLFAVTLSERPYPHYMIQIVPPLTLLLGMLFTLKTLEQSLVIIPLTLAVFVPVYFRFWYYQTLPYYTRFVNFAVGNLGREDYLKTFGSGVPDTYKLAEFIISMTRYKDNIFVWGGDSSNVYALSRRLPPIKYVATYHINDFSSQEEVVGQLVEKPPTLIVILPDSQPFPNLQLLLQGRYGMTENIGGAQVWKLMSSNR